MLVWRLSRWYWIKQNICRNSGYRSVATVKAADWFAKHCCGCSNSGAQVINLGKLRLMNDFEGHLVSLTCVETMKTTWSTFSPKALLKHSKAKLPEVGYYSIDMRHSDHAEIWDVFFASSWRLVGSCINFGSSPIGHLRCRQRLEDGWPIRGARNWPTTRVDQGSSWWY